MKATIKRPDGTVIEVEGTAEEISALLADLLPSTSATVDVRPEVPIDEDTIWRMVFHARPRAYRVVYEPATPTDGCLVGTEGQL